MQKLKGLIKKLKVPISQLISLQAEQKRHKAFYLHLVSKTTRHRTLLSGCSTQISGLHTLVCMSIMQRLVKMQVPRPCSHTLSSHS